MTANEMKLFQMCVSQVDSRAILENSKTFEIKIEQVIDLFYTATNKQNAYRDLEGVVKRLFERKATIVLDENRRLLTRFVQTVGFNKLDYSITLRFADDIVTYISQLEQHFTKYRIKYTKNLDSIHSHRIYQYLVMWLGRGETFKEIEFDELKKIFADGKYSQNGDFKIKVLDVALREINAHTDIVVEMLIVKRRRFFDKVQFKFYRKPEAVQVENQKTSQRIEQQHKNEIGKAKRVTEKSKKDFVASLESFEALPDGTIFVDNQNKKFEKSGALLIAPDGVLPSSMAVDWIKQGLITLSTNEEAKNEHSNDPTRYLPRSSLRRRKKTLSDGS